MILRVGERIHVTHSATGLMFGNITDMPCRVALVTGAPSSGSGLVPIYVFPPYTAPYGGQLDVNLSPAWHPWDECPKVTMELATEVLTRDR